MIADPVFADMLHGPTASSSTLSKVESQMHDHEQTQTPRKEESHQAHGHDHTHGHGHGAQINGKKSPRNENRDSEQEKVRSTLRSFVRDWSAEGQVERDACYTPILDALEQRWPERAGRGGKRVLIPGSGLGRLAMEVASRGMSTPDSCDDLNKDAKVEWGTDGIGFAAQANEFSVYMLIASNFVLNQCVSRLLHYS